MNTHYFRWENIKRVPSKIDPKGVGGGGGSRGGVCVSTRACVKCIHLVPNRDQLWVRRNSA